MQKTSIEQLHKTISQRQPGEFLKMQQEKAAKKAELSETIQYTFLDVNSHEIQKQLDAWERWIQKKKIIAYLVPEGVDVIDVSTQMQSGLTETENVAHAGDIIVLQPNGEMQVIKKESFTQYQPLDSKELDAIKTTNTKKQTDAQKLQLQKIEQLWLEAFPYFANGEIRNAIKSDTSIIIIAPRGWEQAINAWGYIIRRPNGETYGIQEDEFLNTHISE